MYYLYVLKSKKDNNLYIGISNNVDRRLNEHNSGNVKSTKSRKPFELIYTELCDDRKSARNKEKYYKSGIGRETLRKLHIDPRYLPAGRQGSKSKSTIERK